MSIASQFQIVLVEPQNPINVGNVMRAMQNMGFEQLILVHPAEMDLSRSQISAHRSTEMLAKIRIVETLDEALQDCHESYGFSARLRSHTWSSLELEAAAERSLSRAQRGQKLAFVFGREQSGLSNDELARCTHRVHIACNPNYASLNLSQAVLLAVHALFRRLPNLEASCPQEADCAQSHQALPAEHLIQNYSANAQLASQGQRTRLMTAFTEMLYEIGFFKSDAPNAALRRLQNIFERAQLAEDEVQLLLGISSEVRNYARLLARGLSPSRCRPRLNYGAGSGVGEA